MKRRPPQPVSAVDEDNPYWLSFSDLMSALVVIFLLASVVLIIDLIQTRQAIQSDIQQLRHAQHMRRAVIREVHDELALHNILVEAVDNDTVLRIPEKTLAFASNSYTIPGQTKTRHAVTAIGLALHRALNRPADDKSGRSRRYYLDTIFIEGHTDSQPSTREKGNWGLSSFRAISLWEFWQNNLHVSPRLDELTNASRQKLFSISGYAASRPLAANERNERQRQRNRRIDLRFTVKRPAVTELENLLPP